MNLQEYPTRIKNDIEDQSLQLLSLIKDSLVVIGGWGVRAHAQKNHKRYTLDIDAVADEKGVLKTKNFRTTQSCLAIMSLLSKPT